MVEDKGFLDLMQFNQTDLLFEVFGQSEAIEQLAVLLREQRFLLFSFGSGSDGSLRKGAAASEPAHYIISAITTEEGPGRLLRAIIRTDILH